MVRAG